MVAAENARQYMIELLDQLTSKTTKDSAPFILRLLVLYYVHVIRDTSCRKYLSVKTNVKIYTFYVCVCIYMYICML